jgi:hypothetical protein
VVQQLARQRALRIARGGRGEEALPVEEIIVRSQLLPPVSLPFTEWAKEALELAIREAGVFGVDYVGTEHILLAVAAAARPTPPGDDLPAAAQPAAWRDTGKLPATADDEPPGSDPGLVRSASPRPRPGRPGHRADEPRRPRPRLCAGTMAAPPPGPRPMAPLPRPPQSRPRHLTPAGKRLACSRTS